MSTSSVVKPHMRDSSAEGKKNINYPNIDPIILYVSCQFCLFTVLSVQVYFIPIISMTSIFKSSMKNEIQLSANQNYEFKFQQIFDLLIYFFSYIVNVFHFARSFCITIVTYFKSKQ